MSSQKQRPKPGDAVFYIGSDYRAHTGLVFSVTEQSQLCPLPASTHPGQSFETNPDGSLKIATYVQYGIEGQNLHEGRVFSSMEDLMQFVGGEYSK